MGQWRSRGIRGGITHLAALTGRYIRPGGGAEALHLE